MIAKLGTGATVDVRVIREAEVHVQGQPGPALEVELPGGVVRWIPYEWLHKSPR